MRPLLQHASRSVFASASIAPSTSSRASLGRWVREVTGTPSVCLSCRFRASSIAFHLSTTRQSSRHFSSSRISAEEKKLPKPPGIPPEPKPSEANTPPLADTIPKPTAAPKEDVVDNIARVPAEDLPSHREGQRWDLSKRLSELMDELLPKIAVVTQKVNTYTGTDYSGIAALRMEIKEQEKLVKARRSAIEDAKQRLDAAHAQQASSQKEVVALLERKHSWSATDLERYMSLIRSEHVNDQAVREAKEAVASAENALEEARTQLEKRERAQYHEEQIWSDTIRRNSTWVTFGLMGFNIFLLLTSLVILEPWRRRRMVREIKTALEAQKASVEVAPTLAAIPKTRETIEAEIDKVIEPAGTPLESIPSSETLNVMTEEDTVQEPVLAHAGDVIADNTTDSATPGAAPLTSERVDPQRDIDIEEELATSSEPKFQSWQEKLSFIAQDIISERIISMRRIDYTTAVLQGAAAGAVITAAIIAMLRPK